MHGKIGTRVIYLRCYFDFENDAEIIEKPEATGTNISTISKTGNVSTVKKEDTTKAKGTIPHAGGTTIIITASVLAIGLGIYAFKRKNDLKGI